jgi:hypothetical protein
MLANRFQEMGDRGGLDAFPFQAAVRPERILFGSRGLFEGVVGRVEADPRWRAYGCWRVREWLGPKSRCSGCEPVTLDDRDVPGCPPGPAHGVVWSASLRSCR